MLTTSSVVNLGQSGLQQMKEPRYFPVLRKPLRECLELVERLNHQPSSYFVVQSSSVHFILYMWSPDISHGITSTTSTGARNILASSSLTFSKRLGFCRDVDNDESLSIDALSLLTFEVDSLSAKPLFSFFV